MVLSAATLGLAVVAGGCTSIRDHRGYLIDAALVDSVQPRIDNRTSVEHTLGRPTWVSQFGSQDWYYVSVDTKQAAFHRPRTYQQTVLRVRFDPQGNVAAVDRAGMDKVARISPDGKETPTLGRERNFLEDLFGNIGAVGAPGMGGSGGSGGGGPGGGPNGS
jgi:outer membrane protein assembly factor BamE (lipoprotein component of BamABCDE complex)